MLKMGLPMGAAKQACVRDGKDPSIMDLDPEKSLASQTGGGDSNAAQDSGPPLKDDPDYAKVCAYFHDECNTFLSVLNFLFVELTYYSIGKC